MLVIACKTKFFFLSHFLFSFLNFRFLSILDFFSYRFSSSVSFHLLIIIFIRFLLFPRSAMQTSASGCNGVNERDYLLGKTRCLSSYNLHQTYCSINGTGISTQTAHRKHTCVVSGLVSFFRFFIQFLIARSAFVFSLSEAVAYPCIGTVRPRGGVNVCGEGGSVSAFLGVGAAFLPNRPNKERKFHFYAFFYSMRVSAFRLSG